MAETVSRPIRLPRSPTLRLWEIARDGLRWLRRHLRSRTGARVERRACEKAERELGRLSPHALQDIGMPHGFVARRRWQDEREAAQIARILQTHGW